MRPLGDEPINIQVKGITLTGLSKCRRRETFDEWAAEFCDFYPSIDAAAAELPFTIHMPESPLTGPVAAVYVTRANPFPEHRSVMLHFAKGVNGLSLTIGRDLSAEKQPGQRSNPRWTTFVLHPSRNTRPGRRTGLAILRQAAGRSPLPWEFKAHDCRVKVFDFFESTPEALTWLSNGLFYALCNGWEDNALSMDELKKIVRYWLSR